MALVVTPTFLLRKCANLEATSKWYFIFFKHLFIQGYSCRYWAYEPRTPWAYCLLWSVGWSRQRTSFDRSARDCKYQQIQFWCGFTLLEYPYPASDWSWRICKLYLKTTLLTNFTFRATLKTVVQAPTVIHMPWRMQSSEHVVLESKSCPRPTLHRTRRVCAKWSKECKDRQSRKNTLANFATNKL